MTIQWFPGHMAKARRQVTEKLKLVDIIFELVDARLPISSANPMMHEIIHQKRRVVILNKSDMADPSITEKWLEYYEKQGIRAVASNSKDGKGLHKLTKAAQAEMSEKFERNLKRGMRPRAIRAMILGIPNVGKSTLINRLVKKNITQTGNRPGVTKAQQWIKVGKELELLDTPGILWPTFEDSEVGYRLALTGAIKDDILNLIDVSDYGYDYAAKYYPAFLMSYLGTDEPMTPKEMLERLALNRQLTDGEHIDYSRAAEHFVRDFRALKLGRITLDRPEELEMAEEADEEVVSSDEQA